MKRPGIRLSGGAYGGRTVAVPPRARPTEGRVREALFSIWGPAVSGSRFLDLFAGSGAVGLEAAGRGALDVVAVEGDGKAVRTIEANRELLGEGALSLRLLRLPEGLATLAAEEAPFDLVFADPPYSWPSFQPLLVGAAALVARHGELALEHDRRVPAPLEAGGLVRTDLRRYGESALAFYRKGPS